MPSIAAGFGYTCIAWIVYKYHNYYGKLIREKKHTSSFTGA